MGSEMCIRDRLTSDQHRLILAIGQHVAVGSLSDGPQVRRHFILPLAKVHFTRSFCIDRIPLVGVHHNAEQSRISVDQLGLETNLQVVEDRGIIQERQVGHVFTLLELGWVDLTNLLRFEGVPKKPAGQVERPRKKVE